MNLDLQPVRPEDEPFLFELYASTRGDEMALVGWNKPQQEASLRMQFNAQRSSYAMQFPNADYRIIVHDGRAAGRLIVDRSGEDILLIDVALLPEFRNAGIGSALVKQVMAEAAQAQKPFKLHVEKFNRARRLYIAWDSARSVTTGSISKWCGNPRATLLPQCREIQSKVC